MSLLQTVSGFLDLSSEIYCLFLYISPVCIFIFLFFVACAAAQGRLTSLQLQQKSRQGSLEWWRREQPSDLSKTPWEFFSLILFQMQAKLTIHNCSLTNRISYMLFQIKCYTWHSVYICRSVDFTIIPLLDLLDTARAALTCRKHDGELRICFSQFDNLSYPWSMTLNDSLLGTYSFLNNTFVTISTPDISCTHRIISNLTLWSGFSAREFRAAHALFGFWEHGERGCGVEEKIKRLARFFQLVICLQ